MAALHLHQAGCTGATCNKMKTKFRVQQRKWLCQPLYQVRQQNVHRQKSTQWDKAESGVSFWTCCGVSKYQERRNAAGAVWQLPARSVQELWQQQWQKGLPAAQHWAQPSSVLAQLVTFAVMLPFIFSAPLIFTSWPGWVMTWHLSALPHSLSQHQQTQATWSVCPGFPSQGCLYLSSQHFSFALFPSSTQEYVHISFLSSCNI